MKTLDPNTVVLLNKVLKNELTAINQYFLHSKMLDDWGLKRLAKYEMGESIDEMKHADQLIARVLYLDGLPNVQRMFKVRVGENVEECFRADLAVEYEAVPRLQEGVALCREMNDPGTRVLLEGILVSEEEHVDWLEAQLDLISKVGLQNYLAQQIHPA